MGKIKEHFKDNKTTYIVGGSCLAVGAAGAFFLCGGQVVLVDAWNFKWKSPTVNNVTTILVRRGHPGNTIKCNETGELFASQNRAASACGVNAARLSEHLNGKRDQVSGLTFENMGETK